MNLLGHNYIAYKILGYVSADTLVGSHIPDLVPFLPSSVFSFEEIHENPEGLLKYVKENYPKNAGLPLSMMCHSVKYGADEYNRSIDNWLLENNEELTHKLSSMIAEASNVSYEIARGPRLHNYLWGGVDIYLIKNNPENITDRLVRALKNINYQETAQILAEYYKKDFKKVEKNLRTHFKPIKPGTFRDIGKFTVFWSKFLSTLPEGDNLDPKKGAELLEFIYKKFENDWERIIEKVEEKVRKKMQPDI